MAKPINEPRKGEERLSRAKPLAGDSSELAELLATLAKIDQIDLSKMSDELEKRKTKLDKAIEGIEAGDFKLKPAKKKKKHWKTVAAKKKKYFREYYVQVRKPRVAKKRALKLREGGWYALLKEGWDKRGIPVEVSAEEWTGAVGQLLDCYPMVTRYDSTLGIRLDNILIRDKDSLAVCFDGKEWSLRSMGYIL